MENILSTPNVNVSFKVNELLKYALLAVTTISLICALKVNTNSDQLVHQDKFLILEKGRLDHVRELVDATEYKKSKISQFENDINLTHYIEKYLNKGPRKVNIDSLMKALVEQSQKHHYDPVFLLAIIKTESQFNTNAIGSAGEIGLMQIKPVTAKWITEKFGVEWRGDEALKNPEYNVQVGALYFKYLQNTLKADSVKYINAYNRGINNMQRSPAKEHAFFPYYTKVMKNYLSIYKELQKIKKQPVKA